MKLLMNLIVVLFAILCAVHCASLPDDRVKATRCQWNCKEATGYQGGYHPVYDSMTGVCTCQDESGDVMFSRRFRDDKDVIQFGEIVTEPVPMERRIEENQIFLKDLLAVTVSKISQLMSSIGKR